MINLETSVTRCDDFAPRKRVHYSMSPGNIVALTVARPDVCVLANNHVMDFGLAGLDETIDVLSGAGVATAGAGRDLDAAARPAAVAVGAGQRLLVFAVGAASSGIPGGWAAGDDRPGVAFLSRLDDSAAADLADRIDTLRGPDDLVVISVHGGSNWGYDVPDRQTRFAHALIDAGVDLVHGHSSHHPRPIEIHRDRLILYGCGDLVSDYEGIGGHESYRSHLRPLYLASLDPDSGALTQLRIVPMQARRMRLEHATPADRDWLCDLLDRISRPRGVRVELASTGDLTAAVA